MIYFSGTRTPGNGPYYLRVWGEGALNLGAEGEYWFKGDLNRSLFLFGVEFEAKSPIFYEMRDEKSGNSEEERTRQDE